MIVWKRMSEEVGNEKKDFGGYGEFEFDGIVGCEESLCVSEIGVKRVLCGGGWGWGLNDSVCDVVVRMCDCW